MCSLVRVNAAFLTIEQLGNLQEEQDRLYFTAAELRSRIADAADATSHRALGDDGSLDLLPPPWQVFINDSEGGAEEEQEVEESQQQQEQQQQDMLQNGTIAGERRGLAHTLRVSMDLQVSACDSDSDCGSVFYCTIMHESVFHLFFCYFVFLFPLAPPPVSGFCCDRC